MIILKKTLWVIAIVMLNSVHASVEISSMPAEHAIAQADAVVVGRLQPAIDTEQRVLTNQYDEQGNLTELVTTIDIHPFTVERVVSGEVLTDTIYVRKVRSDKKQTLDPLVPQMIGLQVANTANSGSNSYVIVHDVSLAAPAESLEKLTAWAKEIRQAPKAALQAELETAYADTGTFDALGEDHGAGEVEDFLVDESDHNRVEPVSGLNHASGPQDAIVYDDATEPYRAPTSIAAPAKLKMAILSESLTKVPLVSNAIERSAYESVEGSSTHRKPMWAIILTMLTVTVAAWFFWTRNSDS